MTMRKIKFRAWDKENEAMVHPKGILFDGRIVNFSCGMLESYEGYKLMQYTGLKDENGREIYEGDIIKGTYYDNLYKTKKEVICQVRWDKSGYWTFSGAINFSGGYLSDLRNIIVIGNIYENPGLLKEGEK